MKKLFGLLLTGTLVAAMPLSACANDANAPVSTNQGETGTDGEVETSETQDDIGSKIIGTWVVTDENGEPAPANDKLVYDFIARDKARVYAPLDTALEGTSGYLNAVEADYVLDGSTLTITEHYGKNEKLKTVLTITSISDTVLTADREVTYEVDGTVQDSHESTIRCVKSDIDYQNDVLGTVGRTQPVRGQTAS